MIFRNIYLLIANYKQTKNRFDLFAYSPSELSGFSIMSLPPNPYGHFNKCVKAVFYDLLGSFENVMLLVLFPERALPFEIT